MGVMCHLNGMLVPRHTTMYNTNTLTRMGGGDYSISNFDQIPKSIYE